MNEEVVTRQNPTELIIIKHLANWVDHNKYPYQMPNAFIYGWECDYWAMDQAGITREFEIKISRSDFLADSKKGKHSHDNGANYFYYVCPLRLILSKEIDPRYGLMYVQDDGGMIIEKKPRRLHDRHFDNWKMLANKINWRYRALWRQKWMEKEITRDQYYEGLLLTDDETPIPCPSA